MHKLILIILLLLSSLASAQESTVEQLSLQIDPEEMPAHHLVLSFDKTTHLIFPTEIKYVDLGNPAVMAQKPVEVKNILRLKARQRYFKTTNLTVVTADGKLYPFQVSYSDEPARLTLSFLPTDKASLEDMDLTADLLQAHAAQIIYEKPQVKNRAKNDRIKMQVPGIYMLDNVVFFHIYLKNESTINYDIDFTRFYIRDRKMTKRTSVQEIEQIPVYSYSPASNPDKLFGKSSLRKIFALQKFTLTKDEKLDIEVFERNGGRHLKISLSHKDLIKSAVLAGVSEHRLNDF